MNKKQEQQIVSTTLKKLNALPEGICAELTATTKRRKITEHEHSIKVTDCEYLLDYKTKYCFVLGSNLFSQ